MLFVFVAAACLVAGVAVYPAGWSETAVQETCGPTADQYNIGEVNNAYVTDGTSVSGSRKSLALQPVLLMHPHAPLDMDTYSHYSGRTARSKHGIYANTMHNYQL
ncbi:jg7837 [Pararge aegeria aegeria]|uniref:Jg7837 protein n=1 Tax=Pararge aegeria aegeria TaxID=348720 RepID=A0A8S4RL00_9NEOP|nr:jg7837 [Pararge aegeria aegeria]